MAKVLKARYFYNHLWLKYGTSMNIFITTIHLISKFYKSVFTLIKCSTNLNKTIKTNHDQFQMNQQKWSENEELVRKMLKPTQRTNKVKSTHVLVSRTSIKNSLYMHKLDHIARGDYKNYNES